jgi:hypothetical protein
MKSRLVSIKRIIENEIGERIDTKNRRRDLTYARAVFCRTGRDMGLSLATIGEAINRDHATVLHTLNNVYPFVEKEVYYKRLYEVLKVVIDEGAQSEEVDGKFDSTKEFADMVDALQKDNDALRYKLLLLKEKGDIFNELLEGLRPEEIDEVYNKLSIFVKAIKTRVYQ